MTKKILYIVSVCLLLFSCNNNDDDWSKDYKTDFMDIVTSASGYTIQAINDNDETLQISNPQTGLAADTTYRYVIQYTRNTGSKEITLYNAWSTISALPVQLGDNENLYTDPVQVQSIWQTSRYINATLKVPYKSTKHIFKLIDKGITQNSKGQHIAHVTFYHNGNNDVEAYNGTAYMSLPLKAYKSKLVSGTDSIYITFNTEEKGNLTYPFLYK